MTTPCARTLLLSPAVPTRGRLLIFASPFGGFPVYSAFPLPPIHIVPPTPEWSSWISVWSGTCPSWRARSCSSPAVSTLGGGGSLSCLRLMVFPGTNGLGAATAKMLASRNPAKIYITGRKEDGAQQVISDIKSASTTVTWIHCDHASLASVKEAADKILAQESRLDVLIANAGISKHTLGRASSLHRVLRAWIFLFDAQVQCSRRTFVPSHALGRPVMRGGGNVTTAHGLLSFWKILAFNIR